MPARLLRRIAGLALLALAFAAAAEVAVPQLKARVTDLTATLSAAETAALEQRLAAFEARKGSQVAVLLLPTTGEEPIEMFAVRAFEQWKLGRAKVDDGVLLVVAKNDRKVRIEVGYGLEGALPDAIAKRVIDQDITPRFREGAFAAGIEAGVDRMMRVIDGEPLPEPDPQPGGGDRDLLGDLVFIFVFAMFANSILQSMLGRFGAAALTGLGAAVAGYVIATTFAAGVMGALGFLLGLANGVKASAGGGNWSSGRSGWGGGGFGGGGGGFSGGGGGSGGGGASGSW